MKGRRVKIVFNLMAQMPDIRSHKIQKGYKRFQRFGFITDIMLPGKPNKAIIHIPVLLVIHFQNKRQFFYVCNDCPRTVFLSIVCRTHGSLASSARSS